MSCCARYISVKQQPKNLPVLNEERAVKHDSKIMSCPALPSPKASKSLEIKMFPYLQIFAWVATLVIHSLEYYSQAALIAVTSMNEHSLLMTGS